MLTAQLRVQRQVDLREVTTLQRVESLAAQLRMAEAERDALADELAKIRSEVRTGAVSQTDSGLLAQELSRTQLFAGLRPVSGPGVQVVMDDSQLPRTPGENPNNFIIHDEDLLRVINELAGAGAEAISINGQRLIGTSEIRCTGPVVTINGVRTTVPVVITALGNPEDLERAISMRGGPAESLRVWGITVAVSKETKVTVPAYRGSQSFKYAVPDEDGAE